MNNALEACPFCPEQHEVVFVRGHRVMGCPHVPEYEMYTANILEPNRTFVLSPSGARWVAAIAAEVEAA